MTHDALTRSHRGIAGAALILMLGNVAGRLLGLVREQTIAALFGRTSTTDALTAAWRVPTTLYDLLVGGMISAALVPVFADYADPARTAELRRLAGAALGLALSALTVAAVALLLVASPLMALVSPGLAERGPGVEAQAALFLRLMVPGLVCMGLAGLLTALLYARRQFAAPAFGAAAFNAGIVVAAVLLHGSLDVASLAVGLVLGAAVQLALTWLGLRDLGILPRWDPGHPGLRQILRLYLPVGLGLLVSAAGVAVDTNLASRTLPGDLTAMRYATTLVQLPLGLIATALGTAILPALARADLTPRPPLRRRRGGDEGGGVENRSKGVDSAAPTVVDTLGLGLRWTILLIVPAAVGLAVLREPVIRLLFERGQFGPVDTARTALAFAAYAPGIPAAAVDQILITAFYARKDTVTPVVVGVVAVGIYLAVALTLIGPLGMVGLAVANSAQWVGHALIMLALAARAAGSLRGFRLGGVTARSVGGAALMALAVMAVAHWLLPPAPETVVGQAFVLMALGALGIAVYVGSLAATRCPEVEDAWRRFGGLRR
ncbi:MAG: polysaccharide biosynthesis C-terminal domain-containing protein [Chloroflexi bacterium]|nr:polysaccharide biosynthesis C-terminal domain-containing protein [Chloroflexota bacterium]